MKPKDKIYAAWNIPSNVGIYVHIFAYLFDEVLYIAVSTATQVTEEQKQDVFSIADLEGREADYTSSSTFNPAGWEELPSDWSQWV